MSAKKNGSTGDAPGKLSSLERLLRFIELWPFTEGCKAHGLGDSDLHSLQLLICGNPRAGPVVAGTGGLRKLRFAPLGWGKGKRGALRIGYVYLEGHGTVLLIIAYAKNEKDDLSPGEKKAIRDLIRQIEKDFAEGKVR